MVKVLAIVSQMISTHVVNIAGFEQTTAHIGAVTLVQRFGPAPNLNVHFHSLFIGVVYYEKHNGQLRFPVSMLQLPANSRRWWQ